MTIKDKPELPTIKVMTENIFKKIIPDRLYKILRSVRNKLFDDFGVKSYSQEGEDLVLARIFGNLKLTTGFFVDIGAHHPTRFSNTFYFYRRGWCGINVDAFARHEKIISAHEA